MCDRDQRETRDHLFFECDLARQCRGLLDITWTGNVTIHDRIMEAKQLSANVLFMDVIQIAAWELWKLRNAIIFNAEQRSFSFGSN